MILFSADDYGYTRKGSEKILIFGEQNSIIKNTSILANFATSEDLLQLKYSKISKGIHLNIVEGKSIGKHETITNQDGFFFNKSTLLKNILTAKINMQEICNEATLQIEYILDSGIDIIYADSHQNTHFFSTVMNQYEKVLNKFKIKKVRGQTPIYTWFNKSLPLKSVIHLPLAYIWDLYYSKRLITTNKIILKAPGMGLEVNNIEEALFLWKHALKNIKTNVLYEVPCHLDYSELEFELYSSQEFGNLLRKHKIQPISYAELS